MATIVESKFKVGGKVKSNWKGDRSYGLTGTIVSIHSDHDDALIQIPGFNGHDAGKNGDLKDKWYVPLTDLELVEEKKEKPMKFPGGAVVRVTGNTDGYHLDRLIGSTGVVKGFRKETSHTGGYAVEFHHSFAAAHNCDGLTDKDRGQWIKGHDLTIADVPKAPTTATVLPTRAEDRKAVPLCSGVLDYFTAALAEVARVSKAGNDQHNPGQELHWARGKSADHADCIARHLSERGTMDTDGQRHSAKLAWRALALLQMELEAAGAPKARGAK